MSRTHRVATTLVAATLGCALAPAAGAAPVSTGHSPWGWGSPVPQGQDLAAVAFQGADGYAVGAFGTILASDDAGQTWSGLPSPTTTDLDLVQEIDPTTVVAAGGCTVLESTDSGASFASLPFDSPAADGRCTDPVAGVAFGSAQEGYVELQNGTLFFTDDGGASVQVRTAPPLGGGEAAGISFSSPTTGLAASSTGAIDRTTDGGQTWTQVDSAPRGLGDITFVGPDQAYAVGAAEMLGSDDGGLTWTALPLVVAGVPLGAGPLSEPDFSSISCGSPSDCVLLGFGADAAVETSDGGETGTAIGASAQSIGAVAFAGGSTVVGVGGSGATSISQDGGLSFTPLTPGGLSGVGLAPTDRLTAGGTPGTAYSINASGIAATTDAGVSWSELLVPTTAPLLSAAFSSSRVGYVLDGDGVLRGTSDGGASWGALGSPDPAGRAVATPRPGVVVVVGTHGVSRSDDGGEQMVAVRGRVVGRHGDGAAVASLDLSSVLAAHGALVAWRQAGGTIVSSSDGGRTWSAVRLPRAARPSHFLSVSAVSATRIWVDSGAAVYATTDGGHHWQRLSALGALPLAVGTPRMTVGDVSFASARDGIVALGEPSLSLGEPQLALAPVTVLRTSNGGQTWTPEVITATPSPLNTVLATGRGDVAVLDTSDDGEPTAGLRVGVFTTSGVPTPTRASTLTVGFSRPRVSVRGLARAGHRVRVVGHLAPVPASGESVTISYRVNGGAWRPRSVTVHSSGAFGFTLAGVRRGAQVVAQAVGTSTIAGAGTPVSTLTVSR